MPIVTRWGSWMNAVEYYFRNLVNVREIVESIQSSGKIVEKCKAAVSANGLEDELSKIKIYFDKLMPIMGLLEDKKLNIEEAYWAIMGIEFEEDPVGLNEYIEKRMLKNGIHGLINNPKQRIEMGTDTYNQVLKCQPTTIDVERSFSMLKSVMRENRNFSDESLGDYIICYYNK